MAKTETPTFTMRTADLPEDVREAWRDLLESVADGGTLLDGYDLAAHYRILMEATWVSEDRALCRTADDRLWYLDDDKPYPAKPGTQAV